MYCAKQNKSVREMQIAYDFTHTCNLRNKTNEQGGKEKRETEKERGKPRHQPLTTENKHQFAPEERGLGAGQNG